MVILGLILLFFSQEPLHASYLMVVFPVFLLLLVTNIKSQQRGVVLEEAEEKRQLAYGVVSSKEIYIC